MIFLGLGAKPTSESVVKSSLCLEGYVSPAENKSSTDSFHRKHHERGADSGIVEGTAV